ncbi:MAG: hydantoinase/oxoprolinase family protein [Pseudomonadota bacterium]
MTEPGATASYRVGIDVGGTFTDFVLAERESGRLVYHKEPSVPADPSEAVLAGMKALVAQESIDPRAIELVVHGTTLALNTTIQRRGARAALVVSTGNRDVLEIARCRMPSSYDFRAGKETPLVPRARVFELPARIASSGEVVRRPSDADIEAVASAVRDAEVDAVSVLLLNAPANPDFEAEIAAALARHLDGIPVAASTAVWPEIREYERAVAATLNATIQPLMDGYLAGLEGKLVGEGIGAPIYITASNGGTLSIATARGRPIETMLSGPAAGVAAATRVARDGSSAGALPRGVLSFDMGGTSSDIALSMDGEPSYTNSTHVGDLPLMIPVVAVSAIGAGGGSIVWTDAQGVLKVGPNSAGADPGPIAYGRGGTEPTVTDCYLALGIIDPERFLGGAQRLDRAAAEAALERIGAKIGKEGAAEAAEAALLVASTNMASEMLKALAQNGVDPGELALMPFGGAGPTHTFLLADEVGVETLVIPPAAGTFCALGALIADVKRDFVRSLRRPFGRGDDAAVWEGFTALEEEALAFVAGEGEILSRHLLQHGAEMRYAGQGFDLSVSIPAEAAEARDADAVVELFHREHEKTYGFRDLDSGIEITTLRVRAIGEVPPLALPSLPDTTRAPAAERSRPVFIAGAWQDVPVHSRATLTAGDALDGPVIVEQPDTTVFMLPGWAATVDRKGNLIATRTTSEEASR